jgi:V/A-type H+-transporting ATPase subunit D
MTTREGTPTRSIVLDLRNERRAMEEGHRFLDEKCLLLAGEMLRELARHAQLAHRQEDARDAAVRALVAAVARHGLDALQVYPAPLADGSRVELRARSVMGLRLLEATLRLGQAPSAPAIDASPEAEACRLVFAELVAVAAELAAVRGNLERLHAEYRRAVRRTRALQDVLLPEIDDTLAEFETRLAELEQEEAIWMRHGR